jgi:hypothetical protein
MKKLLVNPENPNGVLVDLTAEEIAQIETEISKSFAERQAEEQAKAQKEANKESAQAKLSALGLTTEEIKALIG